MGSWYVRDENSRRVFAKFQQEASAYSEQDIINAIVSFTRAENSATRWKAMRFLIYLKYANSQVIQEYWYREPDWVYRLITIEAVQLLSPAEALPIALEIARFDDSAVLRRNGIELLARWADNQTREQIVAIYVEALNDDDWQPRNSAVQGLIALQVTSTVREVTTVMMTDKENAVRVSASEYLAELGSLESYSDIMSAHLKDLINAWVLARRTERLIARFGQEQVMAMIRALPDASRQKIEDALKE
jgi:hypothetical protein